MMVARHHSLGIPTETFLKLSGEASRGSLASWGPWLTSVEPRRSVQRVVPVQCETTARPASYRRSTITAVVLVICRVLSGSMCFDGKKFHMAVDKPWIAKA